MASPSPVRGWQCMHALVCGAYAEGTRRGNGAEEEETWRIPGRPPTPFIDENLEPKGWAELEHGGFRFYSRVRRAAHPDEVRGGVSGVGGGAHSPAGRPGSERSLPGSSASLRTRFPAAFTPRRA